jgi:hypothetical protein
MSNQVPDEVQQVASQNPGSDLARFLGGVKCAPSKLGPCLIVCQVVFPDAEGKYPDLGPDEAHVAVPCEDSIEATQVMNRLKFLFMESAL